jgi:predicted phage terminase large subunit-like protein
VGGGLTGHGAHLLVVDDPLKNREEASNPQYRKKVMTWYRSSAYTRLQKGGAVVVIHTRWDAEDLAGELLKEMAEDPLRSEEWTILTFPAIALAQEEYPKDMAEYWDNLRQGVHIPMSDLLGRQPGEALWPEEFDVARLERTRRTLGEFEWAALAQQMPRPETGGFLDRADFKMVERAPEGLRWVRYCDLALSEKTTADWNTSVAVGMDGEGNVYYRDMIRVHGWPEFKARLIYAMIAPEERGVTWGIESTMFQMLAFRELTADRRLAGVDIRPIRPEGDKVSRARPLQARAKAGKVYLVKGGWVEAFLAEALSFPDGRHDDQVDTASGGLIMIGREAGIRREASSWQG